MSEFFNVLAPIDAVNLMVNRLQSVTDFETIPTSNAMGRISSQNILSTENLPSVPRSTMDGIAVRAIDTFGATENLPAYLQIVDEVSMGIEPKIFLNQGEAVKTYTGSMLVNGADAVVMVENTQTVDQTITEVFKPVSAGENVIQVGEDIKIGETILESGSLIRPQDIGGLIALGITRIPVHKKPNVAIISTGDELIHPSKYPSPAQIRDINTYTISALTLEAGGNPIEVGIVEDSIELQLQSAKNTLKESDLLVFSAGSSVSSRDITVKVINELGKPGVLAHGISFKPGKPTILAMIGDTPVIGLPGNPVSASVVYKMIGVPIINYLSGKKPNQWNPKIKAVLTQDVPSQSGRQDTVQVNLSDKCGIPQASPSFGNSNLIFTMIRSDGYLTVPIDKGGLYAGEEIDVTLY